MANIDWNNLAVHNGLKIVISEHLVKKRTRLVSRTWKERLTEFPWRPWRKTWTEIYFEPAKYALLVNDTLVMHPETYERFKTELANYPIDPYREEIRRRTTGDFRIINPLHTWPS